MTTPTPAPGEIRLSPRQVTLLRYLAAGRSSAQLARELGIGPTSLKSDLHRLHTQFGARTRAHLIVQAFRYGWLRIERRRTGDTLVVERPAVTVRHDL